LAIEVLVKNGNLELALKKFKKKIKLTGLMQEIRKREYFEKPSITKREKKIKAKIRNKYNNEKNITK